jgi:hypothetical protein
VGIVPAKSAILSGTLWLAILPALAAGPTASVESLWDYQNPELSEARFRQARSGASADEDLILQTQIARTYSLRSDFETAERLLADLSSAVEQSDSAEVACRYYLERGRTLVSATRPASDAEPSRTEAARGHFQRTLRLAQAAGLDALAIDAVHMMGFVDTTPQDQIAWAKLGLEIAAESEQASARQ